MPRSPRLLPILLPSRWTTPDTRGRSWNVSPAHSQRRTVLDDVPTPTDQKVTARLRLVPKRGARARMGEDAIVAAARTSRAWERYAWAAGIVYVIALLAEIVVALGVGLTQNDSAAKIASALHEHRDRLLVIAYLSVVYAAAFLIYLCSLYNLLRGDTDRHRILGSLVLVGGVLFIALHAVSDIGITGLVGAKLASFGYRHDHGVAYTLYLMTYALDSVGDVFGSLSAVAAGLLVIRSGVLPRWLGWVSILAGILLFLQGFGLGGVIASFGLVLDLIGFVLFLIFVLVSSVILLTRENAVPNTAVRSSRQLQRRGPVVQGP